MSPRNSLSQLFYDIFNSLKKRGKPSLQKEEFISLFEDTEDMINDLREQFKMFITSTKKSDLLLMTEDIMTVDIVIQSADSLVTAVIRKLKETEDDITTRKAYLRKQIVSALCDSGNNPKDKGILKKLQKKGLLGKTDLDEIAKTDVCSLEQRRNIIYQNTNTSEVDQKIRSQGFLIHFVPHTGSGSENLDIGRCHPDKCKKTGNGKHTGKRSRNTKKPSNSQNNSSFRNSSIHSSVELWLFL